MNTCIISAKGWRSFTKKQLEAMGHIRPRYHDLIASPLSKKDLIALVADTHILALTPRINMFLDATFFNQLPQLKALIVFSTGLDWIDTHAFKKAHGQLTHLPNYCSITVAEHAIGLLLNFSRNIYLSQLKSTGKVPVSQSLRGSELHGKQLGIIGLGTIGLKIAHIAHALGMVIVYSDPIQKLCQYERVSQSELIKRSDYIVLACPYSGRCVLNDAALLQCKSTAFIVNVSRKQLVSDAICDGLNSGALAGYAVDDVIDPSPPPNLEGKLIQTYHTAWYSNEALLRGMDQWVQGIVNAHDQLTR